MFKVCTSWILTEKMDMYSSLHYSSTPKSSSLFKYIQRVTRSHYMPILWQVLIFQNNEQGIRNLGHFAKYVKLRVAYAPEMPGTFSRPPRVSDPDIHRGTCVTHVPRWMPGSLTCGFLWSRWRRKRFRHSRRIHNPQFNVSGKRPMVLT